MSSVSGSKPMVTHEAVSRLRSSAAPYLAVLVVSSIVARWLQYLTDGVPWFKAQPAAVVVSWIGVALAASLAFLIRRPPIRQRSSTVFLGLIAGAWLIHFSIALIHGDAYNFNALLYLPIIAILLWRPPALDELVFAMRVVGVSLALVILLTLIFEMSGALEPMYMNPDLVAYEKENYWLPVSSLFGIEGRWPGPFGHSGDTGAVSALILATGLAFRGKLAWLTVTVGILGLLLTSVRVAMVAALVGIAILVLFSRTSVVTRVPLWLRLAACAIGVVVVTGVLVGQSSSLTGRTTIWPAFYGLWLTAPFLGVGSVGIATSGGITALSGHAHNLYLDTLVRTGLIGFVAQAIPLGYGIWLSLRAMARGFPAPMAVIATYLVIGITQAMNDWIYLGAPVLMLVLCVLIASQTSIGRGGSAARVGDI